jgi:hypothetical protein
MKTSIVAIAAALMLAACSYNTPVAVAPNLNVYVPTGQKIAGRWLVYTDGSPLKRQVSATGYSCSAHKFPMDISDAFKQSALKTLQNVVEEAVIVQVPTPVSEAIAQGARGVIVLRGETFSPRFVAITNFWDATIDANVEITASIFMDTKDGRILASSAEGMGNAQSGSGGACEGASTALAQATETAMKRVLGALVERLANTAALRKL